jgi:hypothetical protein
MDLNGSTKLKNDCSLARQDNLRGPSRERAYCIKI